MQKYLILIVSLFFFTEVKAQEELDSGSRKEDSRLEDLMWVKDTAYKVFKTGKFANLKVMYPSFSTYRSFIDTSAAGDQSDITQYAMYNSFWNKLRIQFLKVQKKAGKAGIEWRETTLDSFYIDSGGESSIPYAYIHWVVKFKGKKKYLIRGLFINMNDKWFLMDELKFVGLIPEKKKKKVKK